MGFAVFEDAAWNTKWHNRRVAGYKTGPGHLYNFGGAQEFVGTPGGGGTWQDALESTMPAAIATGMQPGLGFYFKDATDDPDEPSFGGDLYNDTVWGNVVNEFGKVAAFLQMVGAHVLTIDTERNGDGFLADGYLGDTHTEAQNRAQWRQRGTELGLELWTQNPNLLLLWYSNYLPDGWNAEVQTHVNLIPNPYEDEAQIDLLFGLMEGMRQANAPNGRVVVADATWFRTAANNYGGGAVDQAAYKLGSQGPRAYLSSYFAAVSTTTWRWAVKRMYLGNGFTWLSDDGTAFYVATRPSPAAWAAMRANARLYSEMDITLDYWYDGTPETDHIADYEDANSISGYMTSGDPTAIATSPPVITSKVATDVGATVTLTCNVSHAHGVLAVEVFTSGQNPDTATPVGACVFAWNKAGGSPTTNFNSAYMECTLTNLPGNTGDWYIIKATSIRGDRAYTTVQAV